MKWSEYDLRLREWCKKKGRPIPGKPEAEYQVDWNANKFFNGTPKEYVTWGSNYKPLVKLENCKTDYWEEVRRKAAINLDNRKKHINV